jgi:hypothetical protein
MAKKLKVIFWKANRLCTLKDEVSRRRALGDVKPTLQAAQSTGGTAMLPKLLLLGPVPAQAHVAAAWLLTQLADKARPLVERFLHDPAGAVGRFGDVLLWQGESGQQVIGTLEGLSESQARIEQVVGRIETAQLGLTSGLGTPTSLSMATLGVTSLAAGFMVWRMNALHHRLHALGDQLSDIQANLKAQDQATWKPV